MPSETKTLPTAKVHQLGWLLVFAVVYADIGTSIFYVPGILYHSIGNLATLAQIITTGVFISIARKYVEICERCPDGGGVVSICRLAFSSWTFLPLIGGSLITVDYFLTSAISGVSGLFYLASLFDGAKVYVIPFAALLFVCLAGLNIIGIKESASMISLFAVIKIFVTCLLLGAAGIWIMNHGSWGDLFSHVIHPGVQLTPSKLMVGYATTWLAYSGLESAAQVSGSMAAPIIKTASKAMWLVIIAVAVLSPPITAVTLYILPEYTLIHDYESLMSALAFTTGGQILGIATVLSASMLLFMACNTAIIGNYHVNVRLADLGFCPAILRMRHKKFGTPWVSILVSAAVPMLVLLATSGSMALLGDLYAFGLLGTLTLSSVSVDKLRWRDGERGMKFWSGAFTTLALLAAWLINIVHKPYAVLFGGTIAAIMVVTGLKHRRHIEEATDLAFEEAESAAEDLPEAADLLTLEEAVDAKDIESSNILISVRYLNTRLLEEAVLHVRGEGKQNAYVIYVDEAPGLFLGPETRPSPEAQKTLSACCTFLASSGIGGIPIWRVAEDAGHSIAEAATDLGVKSVYVGSSKRTFFWRMVRGRILKRLANALPEECSLIIVG